MEETFRKGSVEENETVLTKESVVEMIDELSKRGT